MSSNQMTHTEKIARSVAWYAGQEWKLLPCFGITDGGRCTCNGAHAEPKDIGKHPMIGEWQKRSTDDLATVTDWWTRNPENNIGVHCAASGFIVIDIDPRSGGNESYEKFKELLGQELPVTAEAQTGTYTYQGQTYRGRHIYFRVPEGEQLVGNLKSAGLEGIDIKHNGYVLVAPSRHGSGVTYDWADGRAPWQVPIADAPEFLLQALRKKTRGGSGTSLGQGDWSWLGDLSYDGERVDINKMLEEGVTEGSRAVDIYRLTCAIANKLGVDSESGKLAVETLMIRFNHEKVRPPLELEGQGGLLMHVRRAIDFVANNPVGDKLWPGAMEWAQSNQAQTQAQMAGTYIQSEPVVNSTPPTTYSLENIAELGFIGNAISNAALNGMSVSSAFTTGNVSVPKDPDSLSEAEGGTPGRRSLTDVGNGRRIGDSFRSHLRYTPGIGWFLWDGQYWKPDAESLGVQEISKRLPSLIAAEVIQYEDKDQKDKILSWATKTRTNSRLNAAIESANSDARLVTPVESWDGNDELLGVKNGVIDLKTGKLLQGRPDLHITKSIQLNYTPGMGCTQWTEFIDYATGGDKELQDWIQRAVGYTLTGKKDQDVLFMVYGPPGSGKNTFVETIVKALGTQQYSWPLDSSILAANDGVSSSTDLYHWAELRGKRMVWVDELPESEKLKENAVKKLTGSSEISARSPGEKPFTFNAQAKLWITTNHLPRILDEAMWRRLRAIPWSHVPEKSNPGLKEYLFDPEGGLPGVLAWAVEGAIKYLNSSSNDRLGWCKAVYDASADYRKEEDRIGLFLGEYIKENIGASIKLKELFMPYRRWCEERGERPLAQTKFQRKLQDKGITIEGDGSKAMIKDYSMLPQSTPLGSQNVVDWTSEYIQSVPHFSS